MTSSPPSSIPPQQAAASRRHWLAAGAAGLLLAGAGGGYLALRTQGGASGLAPHPDPLWDLELPQLDGTPLRLASLRGKPLLLNFWATWCAPCVEELPLINAFDQQQARWQVVGIAVDTPENVTRFMQRFALGFPVGVAGAAGVGLARELGNAGGGLPFTVVADANGMVKVRKIGQLHAQDLADWQRMF